MFCASIFAEALKEFKGNWEQILSLSKLENIFSSSGLQWRQRILTPGRTLQLFVLQVLHGNTSCTHVRHFFDTKFSAAAYCKARARLPLWILEQIISHFSEVFLKQTSGDNLWRGHRVFLEDGTGCSMPDTEELQQHFGQPGGQRAGYGFPVAKMLLLFDLGTGFLQKCIVSPLRSHEMANASRLLAEFKVGDIVVGDRGFCSFAHFALLSVQSVFAVFRIHSKHQVDFREKSRKKKTYYQVVRGQRIKKLGSADQLIYWHKTNLIPKWLTPEQLALLPTTILVRELRYRLNKQGFRSTVITLVTTLIDSEKYPKEAIAKLYGLRWEVETNIGYLKTTLGMDVLHCKTVDGVMKEIMVFCLVYNILRSTIAQIAQEYALPTKKISFVDVLRWTLSGQTKNYYPIVNPIRPGRKHPRVVKRRPKAFPRMTRPRNSFPGFLSQKQIVSC